MARTVKIIGGVALGAVGLLVSALSGAYAKGRYDESKMSRKKIKKLRAQLLEYEAKYEPLLARLGEKNRQVRAMAEKITSLREELYAFEKQQTYSA